MRIVSYLSNRKLLNIFIAVIYYIIVVTTHRQVGRFIAQNLDIPLGREAYNLFVLSVGIISLLVLFFLLQKNFRNKLSSLDKKKTLGYLVYLMTLIVIAINLIMVVNVEIIHIAQYCVMAILLFPLLRNFNIVLFYTTILGGLDEAFQHWYLFPDKSNYYDFNDVLINFLGACLGLIILKSQGLSDIKKTSQWYKSSIFWTILMIIGTYIIGTVTGLISIMPVEDSDPAIITLIRKYEPGFWRELPPNVKFHIVRPVEFFILIIILMCSFVKLGK